MHARYRNYTASEVEQNPMVPPTWIVGLLSVELVEAEFSEKDALPADRKQSRGGDA